MYTYKLGGLLITDELYHDDLETMTFGRKDQNELRHHGIKGQSWGKRRFQNEDGSLTAAGRNRYDVGDPRQGVSAYSDTGGRGGSGVSYRVTGTSRGSGGSSTSQPRARIATRPQQTSGTRPVSQSVMNRANNGKKAADNLFGRIGNFASNAAKNVSNTATNAYNNATQWAGDRAKDVSEAAKNIGQNISDWYTGDPNARDAERYDNMVQRFEEAGDRNVNAGNKMLNKAAKTPESAYDLETGQKLADKRAIEGLDQLNYGYDQHDLAKRYGKKADEAQARYESAPRQMLERAGNWVGDRAREAGEAVRDTVSNLGNTPEVRDAANAVNGARDWIGNAARNVGDFASDNYNRAREAVSGVANNVGEAAKNLGQNISDWYTGDPHSEKAERYDQAVQGLESRGDSLINRGGEELNKSIKTADKYPNISARQADEGSRLLRTGNSLHEKAANYGALADAEQAEYDNAPRQVLGRVGDWIGDRANDVAGAARNVGNFVGDNYNRARNAIEVAANPFTGNIDRNTAEYLRRTADFQEDPNAPFHATGEQYTPENLRRQADEYQQRADNSIFSRVGNAANSVGDWAGNAAKDVGNWGAGAIDKGKTAVSNFFSELVNPHYNLNANDMKSRYEERLAELPKGDIARIRYYGNSQGDEDALREQAKESLKRGR